MPIPYSQRHKPLSAEISSALALLLDVDAAVLESVWQDLGLVYRAYSRFTIQRNGKSRQINIPSDNLAVIQQQILQRILYTSPVSSAAYGGVPGRSYLQAAKLHLMAGGIVLQLDVKNAFPTTRYGLVSQALRRRLKSDAWMLGLDRQQRSELAGAVAHLLTIQPDTARWSSLPLGAASSVAAFNLIWTPIDHAINKAFVAGKIRYTRYIDDLVLSCDTTLPDDSVVRIKKILKPYGYQLNTDKQQLTTCDQAVIYGLRLDGQGQLTFASEQINKLSTAIGAAQKQLQNTDQQQQRQAVARLHGIDALLRRVYTIRQRPTTLQFALPAMTAPSLPHNIDELWL